MPMVTGLEGVVVAETNIGLVDGEKGHLVYRGHWAKELAITKTYEEVAYLLWYGKLPDQSELEQFKKQLVKERELPEYIKKMIELTPENVDMMSVVRTMVSAIGNDSFGWPPTLDEVISITAKIPTIIAYRYRLINGQKPLDPRSDLNHTANYLYMLTGTEPSTAHIRALDAYLILTMEHGMNASTFTARVVGSTRSDLASSISAAVGALKGPLHGGAPSEVSDMLEQIGTKENAEPWIRSQLEKGELLMGFGHRVYKTYDPRAEALSVVAEELSKEDPYFELARYVEKKCLELLAEYKPGRKIYTNVEYYAAAVLKGINLPPQLFTPTFVVSRVVGWSAHLIEQAEVNRIFRPQSTYVGELPAE